VRQDGVWCKSGALTRRHLGTLRTTSASTTEDSGGGSTGGTGGKRFLWNRENAVLRMALVMTSTNYWAYPTSVWRIAEGATFPNNCVQYVTGDAAMPVGATLHCTVGLASTSAEFATVGIGVDSTTVPSGRRQTGYNQNTGQMYAAVGAAYAGYPGLGAHSLCWLENGSDGTCNFIGTLGDSSAGLTAWLVM
jgi:hypothetical protein